MRGRTPKDVTLTEACSAAVDELETSRVYIDALERESAVLTERVQTERRASQILSELNETHKAETAALRHTLEAKNETIAAKDAAIASQQKLIDELKRKRASPWRRLGDILIGAGAIAVLH